MLSSSKWSNITQGSVASSYMLDPPNRRTSLSSLSLSRVHFDEVVMGVHITPGVKIGVLWNCLWRYICFTLYLDWSGAIYLIVYNCNSCLSVFTNNIHRHDQQKTFSQPLGTDGSQINHPAQCSNSRVRRSCLFNCRVDSLHRWRLTAK